jgi:hypothetical protein
MRAMGTLSMDTLFACCCCCCCCWQSIDVDVDVVVAVAALVLPLSTVPPLSSLVPMLLTLVPPRP